MACILVGSVGGAAQTTQPVASVNSVAIGRNAVATGYPGIAGETNAETVAIGADARAEGWRCTAVGAKAQARVVSATAIGRGAYASGAHAIAIGRGAYLDFIKGDANLGAGNACGIAGEHLFLGGMNFHKGFDRTGDSYVHEKEDGGDGTARWDVRTFVPKPFTIHGMDAYDARQTQDPERLKPELYNPDDPSTWIHRLDKDVAGGSLVVAAGRGTGTAPGGELIFQTAPAGTVSQNRKNPLRDAVKIDTDYASPKSTPMWLWDNDAKRLKRVMVGPLDSGGPGFRALVVEN